jgi:aminopeptidase N
MVKNAPGSPQWDVPICIKTPQTKGDAACQIVSGPRGAVALDAPQCVPWVFVNAGAHGYFRTAYAPAIIRALAPDIATHLTEPERLSLVADEWALVRAHRHTIGDYLTLAGGFKSERTSGVMAEVTGRLDFVHDYLTDARSRPAFETFVRNLTESAFRELGISAGPNDDDDRRALRPIVIATLGKTGNDVEVSAAARAALDRALAGGPDLDPTAASAIISVAARRGDATLWDRLLAASKAAASPSERYRYSTAWRRSPNRRSSTAVSTSR